MGSCLPKFLQAESSETIVEFSTGNVDLISTIETWEQKLLEAEQCKKTVIANFCTTWCGPCRTISPFYAELSGKHPSLMFLFVDVDKLTELSKLWEIQAMPTFIFLRDRQEIDKVVGANKQDLLRKINAVENSKP